MGLGESDVVAGSTNVRSSVDCTVTPEAATKVILPFVELSGTFTTICVADWLTNVVTGFLTPVNNICLAKSRLVPVIVRLAWCLTGLGESAVIDGSVTFSTLSVIISIGSVPPVDNVNFPVCASAGTLTTNWFKDLLTN